jgi:hypothetical protein
LTRVAGATQIQPGRSSQEEHVAMSRISTALFACIVAAITFVSGAAFTPATAASDALKQATATCKAQVKDRARFHEMSWWAQHKAVKQCIKEAVAGH